MKVLITGAKGQLGKEMVDLSSEYDFSVKAFDKKQLDITDKTKLQDILDEVEPKILVNAAAYTSVDNAENYKKRAYSVNHQGPKNLAEACRERSIFLIHISTDYVFDGKKSGAYLEDDPVRPLGIYGRSKEAGEACLLYTSDAADE